MDEISNPVLSFPSKDLDFPEKDPYPQSMFRVFEKIADWIVYDMGKGQVEPEAAAMLHFFIKDTLTIFFMLAALVFLVGLGRSWMSPQKIKHWLESKSRWIAYLLAVALGAVTPFCSCSSIPLFIGFLTAGIPLGVTMAFLITSPMVNEVAAVLFGTIIGWKFMVLYILTGLGTGIAGGILIDRLKLERWIEPFVFEEQRKLEEKEIRWNWKNRISYAWGETISIVRRVWIYIIFGVGFGAIIHGYVPQDWFVAHAGKDTLWSVPLAVLIGIPLYANATGLVPVAEVLLSKGLPIGTTLALIMSAAAISLPELMILKRVLKTQLLIFFTCFLALAFIILGYLFNFLF